MITWVAWLQMQSSKIPYYDYEFGIIRGIKGVQWQLQTATEAADGALVKLFTNPLLEIATEELLRRHVTVQV